MAKSGATERTEPWAAERSTCTKTTGAISGRELRTGCGDGGLVLQNSIRWLANRMVSRLWAKTQMAHFWSGGRAESTDSSMGKRRRIHYRVQCGSFGP